MEFFLAIQEGRARTVSKCLPLHYDGKEARAYLAGIFGRCENVLRPRTKSRPSHVWFLVPGPALSSGSQVIWADYWMCRWLRWSASDALDVNLGENHLRTKKEFSSG